MSRMTGSCGLETFARYPTSVVPCVDFQWLRHGTSSVL